MGKAPTKTKAKPKPGTKQASSSAKSSTVAQDTKAMEQQAMQAKMMAASFGEIVSILMRSPHYKHYSLADLEWLVMPPLMSNQFSLAEARNDENAISSPVGVTLWATVSEEVDEKLSANLDRPMRLRPDEWKSGDILWLVDAIGAPEAVKVMVERMGDAVFKGKPFKLRTAGDDGKLVIRTITPKKASGDAKS